MGIESIDTRALTRSPLEAKILKVESPSRVWIHLANGEKSFREMGEELNWWMKHRRGPLIMWPDSVYVGALVTVKTTKGWQRGEVTRVVSYDDIRIAMRDWGTHVTKKVQDVFHLPEQFSTEGRTWEAIPCSMANLLPFGGGQEWRSEDIHLTKFLSEGHRAVVEIRGSTEDGAGAYVRLTVIRENGHSMDLREDLLQDLGCGYTWPEVNTEARPGLQDIKY